jgi:Domain of unknown function (DUF4405)
MPTSRSRNALAIYVDILLLATLLLLFSPRLSGLSIHEWLGISLGGTLIVHLLLSWTWINSSTRRVVSGKNRRAHINYILNWLLFVLIMVELTSGIAISQVALPSIGIRTIDDRSWRALHNQTLNWTMLVLGFHLAMNWRPLFNGVRRYVWPRRRVDE